MIKKIQIGNKYIGDNEPCFIIAEAGVNHNGEIKLAKKLIDEAKEIGADAVKFQTYKTEELVNIDAPYAKYQKKFTQEKSQFDMLKKLELSEKEFLELKKYCLEKNIMFLSSAFDQKSADFLNKTHIPAFKIGSGELTNFPLLEQIAKYNKPIILSTGMANIAEIKKAVKAIYSKGNKSLIILHCTTNYPSKIEDANLRAIGTLKKAFKVPIGFSDHSEGMIISLAARAMGACVIERHFTLDRRMKGPDHKSSMGKKEFTEFVRGIRDIEKAFGSGNKVPQKSELEIMKIARKSIVSTCEIIKDQKISKEMLAIRRPGTGIAPEKLKKVIGKIAKHNIGINTILSWKDFR